MVVTTNGHSIEPVKVHAGTAAPAFFQWGASQYALARRYPDNARVANPSLGAGFVAAKPGDILTLWGTGWRVRTKPFARQTLRVLVGRGFLSDPIAFAM